MRFAVLALVFAAVAFVSEERAVDDSSAAHSTYQQSGDSLVQNHAENPPVQEQAAAGASQEFAGQKDSGNGARSASQPAGRSLRGPSEAISGGLLELEGDGKISQLLSD
ncbi:unnamed protein product [Aphanomyces euteiches]